MTLPANVNRELAELVWKHTPENPARMIVSRWERFDPVTQSVEVKHICPNMATPEAMMDLRKACRKRGCSIEVHAAHTGPCEVIIDTGCGARGRAEDDDEAVATALAVHAVMKYLIEKEIK